MGKTIALILAGGRGRRMDILCRVRPKPVLPFSGRYKVIDFTLSNCIHSGIDDIGVLTDCHRSRMATYLRGWSLSNGVRTLRSLEPKHGSYQGTADAVFRNLSLIQESGAREVLVLAADHIYKMDYRELLAFHEQAEAAVTVGVVRVPIEEGHRFGTISVNDAGEIREFAEKPTNPRSNLASMGIYVFNKDVLVERLTEDAARDDSLHDFGYTIIPAMLGRDQVNAFEFRDYWQDIGTPQAYYDANMELVRERPRFTLYGSQPVLTHQRDLPPAYFSEQAVVVNSVVSPGCIIKGYVENSVLSPGVFVQEQAEVWDSVLMSNAFVGYHSVVDSCIIDEGANIGRLCYIGFGRTARAGERDVTVIGKGATIPSHAVIGRNCRVLPHADRSNLNGNLSSVRPALSEHSTLDRLYTHDRMPRGGQTAQAARNHGRADL